MSTNGVPGANPANADVLATGCWAEHDDGSLIFVESVEGSRVIYSIFDIAQDPPVEYRDAMSESGFKTQFSWRPPSTQKPDDKKAKKFKGKKADALDDDLDDALPNLRWTWHDKTPFPWEHIIEDSNVLMRITVAFGKPRPKPLSQTPLPPTCAMHGLTD